MTYVRPQTEYDVKARRISGTRDEKLEQIDLAIQELLAIKTLECASDRPNVRFLAVPKPRSHSLAATVTIIVLLGLLALLLGVHVARAQDSAPADDSSATQHAQPPKPRKTERFSFADFTWLSGNPHTKDSPLETSVFTGEFRVDTNQQQRENRVTFAWLVKL